MVNQQPLLTGRWDDNASWEFYQSNKMPDILLCTAVFCLAVLPHTEEVVLTRNHRGWEMLGGHIEQGESIEQTLARECMEEGGFTPERYKLFGYRKITVKRPVPRNQKVDGFYPFPNSYIPHFIAISTQPLQKPTGEEIYGSRAFSFQEIETLEIQAGPVLKSMLGGYMQNTSVGLAREFSE